MNRVKRFFARTFFKDVFQDLSAADASKGKNRESASEFVKMVVFKTTDESDFEEPDFEMEDIENGYDTDSYIRQGVDKYVDQLFKEGYTFYGKDSSVVDYIKLRFRYIAEATSNPTTQFLIEIAEDIVKYGNAMIVKSRNGDQNALPDGANIAGLAGKDPVVGYFLANPSTMTVQRDNYGKVVKWKQETDAGEVEFAPEDVVHFYYKRKRGNAFGTSFLVPVLDDVRSLRQAEENVLKMMYRSIYPFHHVIVGTEETPGTDAEVEKMVDVIDNMEIDGGVVTTERVAIKPVASDKVIAAEPYLRYMEQRVFSGFSIPDVLWGRGDTANRSTSDSMTSEMSDRIRAIHRIMESFFNEFIIKELLMEGGYDPVLNPEQAVELKFNDNDIDVMIKKEVHAIYKYEHNAITEDEMRLLIGKDPLEDSVRKNMYQELITRPNLYLQYGDKMGESKDGEGTAETNNKQKNGGGNGQGNKNEKSGGTTASPNKSASKKGSDSVFMYGLMKDELDSFEDAVNRYISSCYENNTQMLHTKIDQLTSDCIRRIPYPPGTADIKDMLVRSALAFTNGFRSDMTGLNTNMITHDDVSSLISMRMDVFKDSVTQCFGYFDNKT